MSECILFAQWLATCWWPLFVATVQELDATWLPVRCWSCMHAVPGHLVANPLFFFVCICILGHQSAGGHSLQLKMSDIELPPSVSASDCDSVELPPDVDVEFEAEGTAASRSGICSCKMQCPGQFQDGRIEGMRLDSQALTDKERQAKAFTLVQQHVCDKDGHFLIGRTKWTIGGVHVCRPFWEYAHALGSSTVDKVRKLLSSGASAPLAPLPRMPSSVAKKQYFKADAWFLVLYQDLGEPLAVSDPDLIDIAEYELVEDPNHPLWSLSVNVGVEERYTAKRYLNPGTFEDVWLMYHAQTPVQSQVSKSTLLKCFRERWDKHLRFRGEGQGKRCKICARIDQERVQATNLQEQADVVDTKARHIKEVMADRDVSVRGNRIAEKDAREASVDGIGQLMKITIDGMDQAKFRCPRNLASSAEFDACFRPQLHVAGAVVHGHLEAYFIMNGDLAKDANMNCTVISRLLDLCHERLNPQHSLPRNLIVAADNTTRESKNQHFANFLGYCIATEKFESAEVQFMQTGHTHNELDQRFSSVASLLSRAPILEDPTDFADWIRTHVVPPRGRCLHVEVLDATYDFQKWFHGLEVQLAGLAATHLEPDSNHVWRFMCSSLMPSVLPHDVAVEIHHEDWKGLVPSTKDVVLLVKQYMHCAGHSQAPVLAQPHEVASKLLAGGLQVMPRNILGDGLLREYCKTAAIMGQPPWNLLRAQAYLEKLCEENKSNVAKNPPPLRFVFNYKMKDVALDGALATEPPARPARRVHVIKPSAGEKRRRLQVRRPAAAIPAAAAGPVAAAAADCPGPVADDSEMAETTGIMCKLQAQPVKSSDGCFGTL